MDINLDYQADMLMQKTKHYLITTMGRVVDEANSEELYRALSYALREEIMINWLATTRTIAKRDAKMLYYLSMEYLPGKFLLNNILNTGSLDIVRLALQKMNRSLGEITQCDRDPGLGNGGLGRLASCFLDSLATHHYPAQAYGLRYQYGIFEQQLKNGIQIEAPDCWLIDENPWEFRRDLRKVVVKFGGFATSSKNIHGDEILSLQDCEEVWAVPYDIPIVGYNTQQQFSVVSLRLWTTKESPNNFQLQRYNAGRLDQAAENTALTDVLYPSDYHEVGKRIRLKQEFLLVSASLQDIIRHYLSSHDNLRAFADKVRIQINDTHPALVIPELMRMLNKKHDIPWRMAFDMVLAVTGYTNHTILKEALEEWDHHLFQYLLPRQAKVIEKMNFEFCNAIRARYPNDEDKVRRMSIIENGKIRMANMSVLGSYHVNGVAELHTDLLKSTIFKDFYEIFPEKFVNITNGITPRRWLLHCNRDLAKFITKRIGDGWITDFSKIQQLEKYGDDEASLKELLSIKKRNKQRFLEFLNHENKLKAKIESISETMVLLDTDSLFDVQIKRIHEYKRQLLNALHAIMLYHEILKNPKTQRVKRTIIFAGKAAAGYVIAKDIIRLIYCIGRKINKDPRVNKILKVIFVENYNVTKAEYLIPAADLSVQISTAGMEASGTGNMKLSMNGALTIATNDGANIEMRQAITDRWWPFAFGASAEEIAEMRAQHSYRSWEVCSKNLNVRDAVDALRDHTFAETEGEHQVFSELYNQLMEGQYGEAPDRYFVLKDLESYYETQKNVEELFLDPMKWAQYSLHNIAGMGLFTSDNSINNYAKKIWGITPCPIDEEILQTIRFEYSELDKCRIY